MTQPTEEINHALNEAKSSWIELRPREGGKALQTSMDALEIQMRHLRKLLKVTECDAMNLEGRITDAQNEWMAIDQELKDLAEGQK